MGVFISFMLPVLGCLLGRLKFLNNPTLSLRLHFLFVSRINHWQKQQEIKLRNLWFMTQTNLLVYHVPFKDRMFLQSIGRRGPSLLFSASQSEICIKSNHNGQPSTVNEKQNTHVGKKNKENEIFTTEKDYGTVAFQRVPGLCSHYFQPLLFL